MMADSRTPRAGPAGGAGPGLVRICPNPLFIVGSPRSGTTVLARSLAEHSELWASGESHLYSHLFAAGLAERAFDGAMLPPGPTLFRLESVSREEFLAYVGLGINALITSRSEGRRWIDHTPHYALIAGRLAEIFPGASFIHMLRDGREVVQSMLNFARSRHSPAIARFAEQRIAWASDMRPACETWRDHVEAAMAFCDAHPSRALVVRYEDLVAAPESTFRTIHAFLGLAEERGPARFLASRRFNSSFGARPRPSAATVWQEWSLEDRGVFAEVAGTQMLRCGYSTPGELESRGQVASGDRP